MGSLLCPGLALISNLPKILQGGVDTISKMCALQVLHWRKTSPGQPSATGSWREEASIYHDNSYCDASQMGTKHTPQVFHNLPLLSCE